MPCRRPGGERLLLLPSGGSPGKEVDALVARLGEALQLSAQHRTAAAAATPTTVADPPRLSAAPKRDRAAPYHAYSSSFFLQKLLPAEHRSGKQRCGRGWLRGRERRGHFPRCCPLLPGGGEGSGDDPQRLLQQLLLSGNLIKEAVRRLQRAASAAPTAGEASDAASASSSSSSSSAGSWCPSSGGEEAALP